jgi:predicted Zn-dependent protease
MDDTMDSHGDPLLHGAGVARFGGPPAPRCWALRNPARDRRAGILGALVVLLALALACPARPPPPIVPGATPPRPPPELATPWQDEAVGREEAENVDAQLGLVDDPELLAYVEAVGQRIARHAPGFAFQYTFRIVDDEAPNAFALPGGPIYITRGAIALTNSEDELASVLAHEIAHVASRHAAARQHVVRGVPAFLQILQLPYLAAYSRELEVTADRLGQELAAAAGYDPAGLVGFLDGLGALERITLGGARIPNFLDTHPGTRLRASEAAQRAHALRWTRQPGIAGDRQGHLRRLEGLVVGESAAQGIFDGTRFLHAVIGFTIRFPDRWETHNTPYAVGARAPARNGHVFLEHGGPGEDVATAAWEWAVAMRRFGLTIDEIRPLRLGGLPAQRVTGGALITGAPARFMVTFIPWRGRTYRLVGVTTSANQHMPVFVSVARSFRPLTRDLLSGLEELRVRVVPAQAGESLSKLSARTGNRWPLAHTAVMNAKRGDEELAAGELLKIAVAVPYAPREARDDEAPPGL